MKTTILALILLTPLAAQAQEPIIHAVAPRVEHLAIVDGHFAYITDTISLEPVYFVTKREQDSVRIICFRELLAEDHVWLSRHLWRNDSTDGIYRRTRIVRNEGNLHSADSAFTTQYGSQYTSK